VWKPLLLGLLLIAGGVTREGARRMVERNVRNAWAAAGTIEKLDLILIDCDEKGRAKKSQMEKIFPVGMSHLPEKLKSLEVYCTTRQCKRHIQYLGRAEESGFQFALFRWVKEAESIASLRLRKQKGRAAVLARSNALSSRRPHYRLSVFKLQSSLIVMQESLYRS
jgi:hypothetical protein